MATAADPNKLKPQVTQTPAGPPRFMTDWKIDMPALRDWLAEFYLVTVVQSGLLDPVYQQTTGVIDFEHLPDPTNTTIARAQKTANLAWESGEQFKEDLEAIMKKFAFGGRFTISDGNVSGNPVFPNDVGTTNYFVTVTPSTAAGAPANDAFRIVATTRGTGGIGVSIAGAPGVGSSVTYDYIVIGVFPTLRETEETP